MQFLGKLTKQTWENGKKTPNFRPNFGLLGPNLCPKNIFAGFTFTSSPSSDPLQFKGRLMNQTEEIDKKPNFGPDFGWPKFDRPNFFSWVLPILVLDIVVSYHSLRFQEKLMNKIWENGKKKPSAGLYFDPNSGRHFFFFSKIWLCQFTRYHGQPSLLQYQNNNNNNSNNSNNNNNNNNNKNNFVNFTWFLFANKIIYNFSPALILSVVKYSNTRTLLETFVSVFTSFKVLDFSILYYACRIYSRSFLCICLLFCSL